MTYLNTEYVATESTGKLNVGDVVELVNVDKFESGVKVGQRAVVIDLRTILVWRFAVLAYEVEGLPHLTFRNIEFDNFEDEVKFLGRQVDADAFQKQFVSDLGASQIKVLEVEEYFDEDFVEVGGTYPILGTQLRPTVEWLDEEEGTVSKITGWEEKYKEKVAVFGVRDGYTQTTELEDHVQLAIAS